MYRAWGKRLFDICAAAAGLSLLAPLLAFVGVVVRFSLGSPVIYRQARTGRLGHVFTLFKFRSMTEARDNFGRLLPDEQRLTGVGRFLRRTSIDELPQLLNVLRGEMSIVGPRPLLPEYLPRYSPTQNRRHDVRAGITGWAQVQGRNSLTWEDRFQLDVWYVERVTFWLDMKILAHTVLSVFSRRGVSAPGHSTMPEFLGRSSASIEPATRHSESREVHVIGAGGHAKVVIATLELAGWNIAAVYDDDPNRWETTILGHRIVGPVSLLEQSPGVSAVIAIGNTAARERLAASLPLRWISAVHPQSWVHRSVKLGEGTLVFAGAVVQPDAMLGPHVVINTSASVDHDCVVESFTNVGPGAHLAGAVKVGAGCDLGTGCSVIPAIHIGAGSIVGAGAAVVRDVASQVVVAGCPARELRKLGNDSFQQRSTRAA